MPDLNDAPDLDATVRVAEPVPSAGSTPRLTVNLPLPEALAKLLPEGTYTVESFLGQGGMGAVYRGTQVRLQRQVAIKIMCRDQGRDHGFEERFRREALALAQLNHPNIVNVIDYGEAGPDYLYIVMEFVDGTDLVGVIRSGQMTQETALKLLPQICDALQFAHDNGIVHRDIKPANILLTRDGRIKMADFGLAKRFDVNSTFHTQTGAGMGTPDYAAPEQFDPHGNVDHRADIYALGVMIYQMVTGQLPRGAWKPPSEKADVDAHWDKIVSHALQTDPSDRYASVSEIKTDISSISLPVSGHGRQTVDGAAQNLALASAAKQANTAVRTQAGGRSSLIQTSVTSSKSKMPLFLGMVGMVVVIAAGVFFALKKSDIGRPTTNDSTPTNTSGILGQITLPSAATKDTPFVNTLGMKFVPVPIPGGLIDGQRLLFSVCETRVQDYAAYAKANQVDSSWTIQQISGQGAGRELDHPVCGVNWDEGNAFCRWLTEKEIKGGKLPVGARYRLPTDLEWSRAAGMPSELLPTPKTRSFADGANYPWGIGWPPLSGAGNYADSAFHDKFGSVMPEWLEGYTDGFPTTAPVGSFTPNTKGIHDMGGNVWEWCEDAMEPGNNSRVVRGGSWNESRRDRLLSSARNALMPGGRGNTYGFRCVLEISARASAVTHSPAP